MQGDHLTDSTDMEQQQGIQLDLFPETRMRHGDGGRGGTEASAPVEQQASAASEARGHRRQRRALTTNLMEAVCHSDNLNRAYKRVKANRGAAGIDQMPVEVLLPWLRQHKQDLIRSLLAGSYQPQPVRAVEIPKPGGGVRQLGIPTVVDRLVQQALRQVLEPVLDPSFSASSYGFRPGRNAHQALKQAQQYVAEGRRVVVDIDLERFFDRVNHDLVMARLARHVADKRLLKIVRGFLEAGILQAGLHIERYEGTPQGGPLSPLLANLLLDDLDKELERRGHRFCRYADDCNIYVRTQAAGERVMASISRFLEQKLRLVVNPTKSAVAFVWERSFLGHRLLQGGVLGIAPESLKRAKARIRQITRRSRGISLARMIGQLNGFVSGWVSYFRHAQCRNRLRELDRWIRRRLRQVRLKQCKRAQTLSRFLQSRGVPAWRAWILACSGKGWWRMAGSPPACEAMNNRWFEEQGLLSLRRRYASLPR